MLQMKLTYIFCAFFFYFALGTNSTTACSIPPTAASTEKSFRRMIDRADYIFVGIVSHVLRRRWNADDTPPKFHPKILELAKKRREGQDIGSNGYRANWVEFAEATVHLSVISELYTDRLDNEFYQYQNRNRIPVDLLNPFTVGGHGPCNSFPRTCPWDIAAGERVALAIQKNNFGAHSALICVRVPKITNEQLQKSQRNKRFIAKYEAIRPFLPSSWRWVDKINR